MDPNGLIWQTRTTVKDNVSTTEYKWVWQDDPEEGWERVTDFWVDVVAPDGTTVGLRLNPNGPKTYFQKLLELDPGFSVMSYQDDYHVNGYEYTPSSEDRRRNNGIDMMPNQAFEVGMMLAGPEVGLSRSPAAAAGEDALQMVGRGELLATERVPLNGYTKRLIEDIRQNGICQPLEFVELNGEKFVTNGNHRLFAAYALDQQAVPAVRVGLPTQQFKTAADLLEVPRSSFLKPLQWLKPGN